MDDRFVQRILTERIAIVSFRKKIDFRLAPIPLEMGLLEFPRLRVSDTDIKGKAVARL